LSEASAAGPSDPGPANTIISAELAHLVADPAAEHQRAAGSAQDVLLPQDMLPGSSEEAMTLREGLRKTGARTFVILAIIVTLDM
jgi:hypothetical protein